jgi:hypothetical protein
MMVFTDAGAKVTLARLVCRKASSGSNSASDSAAICNAASYQHRPAKIMHRCRRPV